MQEKEAMETKNHDKTFYHNLGFKMDENTYDITDEPVKENVVTPVTAREQEGKQRTQEDKGIIDSVAL